MSDVSIIKAWLPDVMIGPGIALPLADKRRGADELSPS